MKSESMRHNTIKIKNKKQLHFVLIFLIVRVVGVRNKLQQFKLNYMRHLNLKRKKERETTIHYHTHTHTNYKK